MIRNTPPQQSDDDDITDDFLLLSNHKVIVADVLFGSPRNNCAGQGICKVTAPVSGQLLNGDQWSCKRSVALIRLLSDQLAVFHFVKASMCDQVLQTYFNEAVFVVEESVAMSLNKWRQNSWQIIPGYYPITTQGNYFTTIFKIKSQLKRGDKIGLYSPHQYEQMNNIGE